MKITTNNIERAFLRFSELTQVERVEALEDFNDVHEAQDADYIRYKGVLYSTGDFDYLSHIDGWHGVYSDTVWSGVLIRLVGEGCVMGSYTS